MLILALNVWLIVLDDADVSLLFNPARHTPNLDRIYSGAVVFDNVYVEGAVCRPSLAALDLGMSPRETTIYANSSPRVETTKNAIAGRLRDAGYTTFRGGKFWASNWGGTPDEYGYTLTERVGNGTSQEQTGFVRAGNQEVFLDALECEPFFACWSPMLPHTPFDAAPEYAALIDVGLIPSPPEWVTEPLDLQTYYVQTRDYLANLARLDAAIGVGLDALETSGAIKNTLIIVTPDNGWSYGHVGKRSPYDRGMRVSTAFYWCGLEPAERHDLHYLADIPATIAEFAGLPLTPHDVEGSMYGACYGGPAKRTHLVGGSWAHVPYPGDDDTLVATWVRAPGYKYIRFHVPTGPEWDTELRWLHWCVPYPVRLPGDEELHIGGDRDERDNLLGDPAHAAGLAECRAIAEGW